MFSPSAGTKKLHPVHHERIAVQNDTMLVLLSLTFPLPNLQNTGPSVSRLPSECLASIFMTVAEEDRPSRWSASAGRTRNHWDPYNLVNLGWLRITHVCRRWRSVALENPLLWTNVVFCLGRAWRDEFLRRARGSPLTIALDKIPEGLVTSDGRGLQDIISQHLDHTKKLVLSRGKLRISIDRLASVLAILSRPAPILESFCLYNADPAVLPSDLFAHHAPRLRRVVILRCGITWPLPEFTNLVYLHIEDCRRGRGKAAQAPEPADIEKDVTAFVLFWFSLQRIPLLETLVLESSMPAVRSAQAAMALDYLPLISFHHLQKLSLKDDILTLGVAVARLVYPSTPKQEISVYGLDGQDGSERDLESLQGWLIAPCFGTIRKLTVRICGWRHIEILPWTIEGEALALHSQHPARSDPPFLTLSFHYVQPMRRPLDKTAFLCNSLPLHDLEVIEMIYPSGVGLLQYGPRHFWHQAFGRCKNVRHVTLGQCCGPVALWALCGALVEDPHDPLFPTLVSLTVSADFAWNDDGHAMRSLGDVFLDMLMLRAAYTPLHSLDLGSSSGFDDAWIDCVTALVGSVHLSLD